MDAEALAPKTAAARQPAPPIGQPWPGEGGIYAGIARGRDGQPDHHLIVAEARSTKQLTWKKATAWAEAIEVEGHADFTLFDRFEAAVLFGNVGELFERDWHWTSTTEGSSTAWGCDFLSGDQYYGYRSAEGCAVAVRRLTLNPSILSEVSA